MLRGALILVTALAASSQVEAAQALRPAGASHIVVRPIAHTPDLAPALFAKLALRLTPAGRSWVEQMSATLRYGEMQPADVQAAAGEVCHKMLQPCASSADIEELAFVVLMQAAQDQADDIRDVMAGVKAINVQEPPLRRVRSAIDKAHLDAEIDKIKQDIDSQSELGETESLRLQMAMDRLSKLMETLSNLLKKISDTDSSIIQNLK